MLDSQVLIRARAIVEKLNKNSGNVKIQEAIISALDRLFDPKEVGVIMRSGLSTAGLGVDVDNQQLTRPKSKTPVAGVEVDNQPGLGLEKPLPFFETFRNNIAQRLDNLWTTTQEFVQTKMDIISQMSPNTRRSIVFATAAVFGALILFSVYKLVKWVLKKKEEKTVTELENNCKTMWTKLKEGDAFITSLRKTLREDVATGSVDGIVTKAKPIADDANELLKDVEDRQAENKSVIKKYAYILLSGIISFAVVFVTWYFYAGRVNGKISVKKPVSRARNFIGDMPAQGSGGPTGDYRDRYFQSKPSLVMPSDIRGPSRVEDV